MIELIHKNSRVKVHPWKGGSVSHWSHEGRDILYCDPNTFQSSAIKYKGGIPVMFPIFSTTCLNGENDISYDGKRISLPQHGFARISKLWRANQTSDNSIVMYLQTSDESFSEFPFAFEFEQHIKLEDNTLKIRQYVNNPGNDPLPFIAGIHPYFKVSDPINCEVNGIPYGTPYYLQLNTGERDYNATLKKNLTLGSSEINHHFRTTIPKVTLKDRATGHQVTIEKSKEYPCITVWSELNEPFICIEPNTGRRGALETRQDLIRLPAGEKWSGEITLTCS
jgi:galactose mutarotase-like enzyme